MSSSVMRTSAVLLLVLATFASSGCKSLDGRNRNRQGNRLYHDGFAPDAIAQYEKALSEVDDPVIHYNLGLAYQKAFRPGYDKPVLLAQQSEDVCSMIPNVKQVDAQVCMKEGDRHYIDCDDKTPCAGTATCKKATFCALDSKAIANVAGEHLQKWIKVQPSDDEIKKAIKALADKVEKLVEDEHRPDATKPEIAADEDREKDLGKEIDELQAKGKTRAAMTQMWLDSDQFNKAIEYWTGLLQEKPNDPDIMGALAGINLKANDWRKSIEWYLKVSDAAPEVPGKVAALQFIGNVAWSKLNSKKLTGPESVELADRGLGALQKAAQLQPDNPRLVGLQGSIYNFRALAQGASWAASLDRATAQDLKAASNVMTQKAKKAAESATPATPTPAPTGGAATNPGQNPAKTGG